MNARPNTEALMKKRVTLKSILLLLLICCVGEGARCQEIVTTPEQLARKMAEQYSSISSYQDYGVVETIEKSGRRRTNLSFKTYFTRPRLLRFQWVDHTALSAPGRSIVWYDGRQAYGYHAYEPDKVEKEESLSMAVAGATGISLGSAHTVPALLTTEIGGFTLRDLEKLTLSGQERFEGEDCYILKGNHPNGDTYELWVSKSDYLLRKLREPSTDGFDETTYRDVKINEPLPAETFQIKPTPRDAATNIASKAKEADIRRLMALAVPKQQVAQGIEEALGALRAAMPKVSEKVWNEVTGEVGFNADQLLEIYVPLFDQHYTEEEVKGLIDFYSTPLGKKVSRSGILIETSAIRDVDRRVRLLIQQVLERLKAKGYQVPLT